ncbi:MAG: amidohydrolase family protein [Deltaproteobacteria bacterium]
MVIDLHAHYLPRSLLEAIEKEGGPYGAFLRKDGGDPTIMVAGVPYGPICRHYYETPPRIADMDKAGVDLQVLSLSPPMVYWADAALGTRLARLFNDELAAACAAAPDRLAGLATLPVQDVTASIAELDRAMLQLGLRGAAIGSNIRGKELDDPELLPLFARAEELKAVIFLHPIDVVGAGSRLKGYYIVNGLGNPFDTAIAASRLMYGGILDRFPKLQVVLAHAGGALPYVVGRLDHVYKVRPEGKAGNAKRKPSAYLRRFHYDTIAHAGEALRYLVSLVGSDRVVVGSDYRYDMGLLDPLRPLDDLSPADRKVILKGASAERMLRL